MWRGLKRSDWRHCPAAFYYGLKHCPDVQGIETCNILMQARQAYHGLKHCPDVEGIAVTDIGGDFLGRQRTKNDRILSTKKPETNRSFPSLIR